MTSPKKRQYINCCAKDRQAPNNTGPFLRARAALTARLSTLRVPTYPSLWCSGLFMSIGRWASLFSCSYIVTQSIHNPLLVQATGALFFAPMLLTGKRVGSLSDRFDRRHLCVAILVTLAFVATLYSILCHLISLPTWSIFPFAMAMGFSTVTDTSVRLPLVYELVGDHSAPNALPLESIGMGLGGFLGPLAAGDLIQHFGILAPFWLPTATFLSAAILVIRVRKINGGWTSVHSPTAARIRTSESESFPSPGLSTRRAVDMLRAYPSLVPVLSVTVIMNVCFFSYVPLVPGIASNLGVSAFLSGLLASSASCGNIIGSLGLAIWQPRHRGLAYAGGSAAGLLCLVILGVVNTYGTDLVLFMVAGLGQAGFGGMQGLLTMRLVRSEVRGTAMGMLSIAIGTMPLGLLGVGVLASVLGSAIALSVAGTVGMVAALSVLAASRTLRGTA